MTKKPTAEQIAKAEEKAEETRLQEVRTKHAEREARIETERGKLEELSDEDLDEREATLIAKQQELGASRAEADTKDLRAEQLEVQVELDPIAAEKLRRYHVRAGLPGSNAQRIGG